MTREEIIRNLKYTMKKHENDRVDTFGTNISLMCKDILDYLEQQPCDTVSRGAFEQVMWERDVAIGQLKELGYGLGQKVEPCDDAISRKSIKQKLQEQHDFFVNAYGGFSNLSQNGKSRVYEITNCISMVVNEPPVTPQQKYGKWILADEQNKEDVENDNYRFICSECQCSDIHAKGAIVPYCWKCGAKMQESEEIGEIHCNHTETEIAKSFIEDVEAVKELLPKAGSEGEKV